MPLYTKQSWVNEPTRTTPINAERLSHIEQGIYDATVDATSAAANANQALVDAQSALRREVINTNMPTGVTDNTLWVNRDTLYLKHEGWWYPQRSPISLASGTFAPTGQLLDSGTAFWNMTATVPASILASHVIFVAGSSGATCSVPLCHAWHVAGATIPPHVNQTYGEGRSHGGTFTAFHNAMTPGQTYNCNFNVWPSTGGITWESFDGQYDIICYPMPVQAAGQL